MLTFSVSISSGQRVPYWTQQQHTPRGIRRRIECQTESLEHVTVLEQATMAVLAGYLRGPRSTGMQMRVSLREIRPCAQVPSVPSRGTLTSRL
jgi:hypothetical protein